MHDNNTLPPSNIHYLTLNPPVPLNHHIPKTKTMADKMENRAEEHATNKTGTNDAKDVAGRENKGMGMADKLAGAVKDPVNQVLGGNNQASEGDQSSYQKPDQTPGRNF